MDQDDERTLAIEEEYERAGGQFENSKELCNLMEEAELPLELLLERYTKNIPDESGLLSGSLTDTEVNQTEATVRTSPQLVWLPLYFLSSIYIASYSRDIPFVVTVRMAIYRSYQV